MSDGFVGLIGLEREEVNELERRVARRCVSFDLMPKVQLREQQLYLARFGTWDWTGPIDKVVFHGIFEDDLPGLAALALWGGPCLPSASGLLDCRPRIANLARVRKVSRFAALGIPALNYGPGDPALAHAPDEHVEIGRIRDGAATLHRWLTSYE